MVIWSVAAIAFTALVTLGPRAHAQPSDADAPLADVAHARGLFTSGVEKAQAQQWKAAEDDFRASHALVSRPSTLYNLALVVYRQRRYQDSAELCRALLASGDPITDATYRSHAEALLGRIREEAASVEVIIAPEHAAWSIDGQADAARGPRRQVMLAPGFHALDFSADGYEQRRVELSVAAADRHTVTVELSAVAAQPPAQQSSSAATAPAPTAASGAPARTASAASRAAMVAPESTAESRLPMLQWLLFGTGGALLAAGAVTGVLALEADAEFEEKCPGLRDCDPSLASLQDRTEALSTATDVLLASGGVAVGGAIVWLLLSADRPSDRADRTAVPLVLTPSGLSLRARF